MRHIILSFVLTLLATIGAAGQSEQEAIKILDSFSAKAKQAPSVSIKFDIIIVNQPESSTDTLSGSLILSGNKYRLELPDNIIFFNGESSWSYLPAEKEVTVTNVDNEDDSFMSNPSSLFSMYKNGYKCRLIEEKTVSYTVDLYPQDLRDEVVRIRLVIGKPQMNLITVEYKRRDGITSTLHALKYDLTQKPSPEAFTFNKEKYKDVEVVDMR